MTTKPKRAMVAAGLNWKTKQFNTRPKICGLCGCDEVYNDIDNSRHIVGVCDNCGAWHPITKGDGSWWYHEAQLPNQMAPTFRQSLIDSEKAK
jgi:hypothetical protein